MLSRTTHALRRRIPPSLPLPPRLLSTTPSLRRLGPEWPEELIGSRAKIQQKREAFEAKYGEALKRKAQSEGITVEELKARGEAKAALKDRIVPPKKVAKEVQEETSGTVKPDGVNSAAEKEIGKEQAEAAKQVSKGCNDTGVKPLHDILDLSKAASLSTAQISALWTTYHQQKNFLSAAIPVDVYKRMSEVGKNYPLFVLPLAREPTKDAAGVAQEEAGAVEMHLLQWAFLPPPSTALEPIPPPSTVLFTPLLQYQTHQTFAQPYLILTHYSDLANSHNVVLMRGELTDNVALSQTDAQVLGVRMQLFYNWTAEGGKIGEREEKRRALLKTFHERPQEFDLEELVKTAWELD